MKTKCIRLLGSALCAAALQAGPRASSSYSIPAESIDSGGTRAASGSYTNIGSVGGISGTSSVAAPLEIAKAGYIGQLYDVIGLTLTAASPTVNEGDTNQLGAWQTLDDATFLAVRSNLVAWGIAGGPITGIDVRGLATAGLVYQNTAATVQGTYLGRTGTLMLTVQNVNRDDFGSYGSDGIDDAWQVQYFGLPPNANAGPTADPTGGGQNNLYKYVAGLDPLDVNSRFVLTAAPVPGQPTQKALTFSPRFADRAYQVQFCTDLTVGNWQDLTGTTQVDNGNQRTVTDNSAVGPKRHYRVQITKP